MDTLDPTKLPTELVNLGHKIVDISHSVLRPVLAKRDAKAKIIEATADAEASHIRTKGELEDLGMRWFFEEQMKQRCQDEVVAAALDGVGDERIRSDTPDPHPDVVRLLLDGAAYVSEVELQVLWGKTLAGEVREPGSVSRRTISVLRTVDQHVATIFARFCALACYMTPTEDETIDGRVLALGGRAGDNALAAHGLSYNELTILSEHGLVVHDFDAWRDYGPCVVPPSLHHPAFPFRHQGQYFVLQRATEKVATAAPVKFRGPHMTLAGMELSRVVDAKLFPRYLKELRRFFQSRGFGINRVELPSEVEGKRRP
ncbi:DUF2806 domain-containing protein [Candidatus Palauibacter sp.]|uniref:DUF2806 domain-containing protein n=1 Tax=Candidatus Palauibacter sp. TaxID=3101350 RepID=UPI003B524F82